MLLEMFEETSLEYRGCWTILFASEHGAQLQAFYAKRGYVSGQKVVEFVKPLQRIRRGRVRA